MNNCFEIICCFFYAGAYRLLLFISLYQIYSINLEYWGDIWTTLWNGIKYNSKIVRTNILLLDFRQERALSALLVVLPDLILHSQN